MKSCRSCASELPTWLGVGVKRGRGKGRVQLRLGLGLGFGFGFGARPVVVTMNLERGAQRCCDAKHPTAARAVDY